MKIAPRRIILRAAVLLILAGCRPAQPAAPSPEARLTPYLTSTPPAAAASAVPPSATPPPAPTPTPTPFLHEVALNETISSLALRYGVSMGVIINANPDVDPRALTVGTHLIIPGVSPTASYDPAAEPLPLEVSQAACQPTPEGGLWCSVLVSNPLNRAADGLIVAFTVSDESGQTLRQSVPALLNHIDPGQTLPAAAYFPPPALRAAHAAAELVSALPVEAGIRTYLDVSLQNERVVIQERRARATIQVILTGTENLPAGEPLNLWVAAAAYDVQGHLLGIRRLERQLEAGEISAGEPQEVSLLVYSSGGVIQSVRLSAEAFIQQP